MTSFKATCDSVKYGSPVGELAPNEYHRCARRSCQDNQPCDVAIEFGGRQVRREHVADEKPPEESHRERLDCPIDQKGDADTLPVSAYLMQGTEIDFHEHGDDHHPYQQTDGDVDLRHFHASEHFD